jgi:hypothetical protein
MASGTTPRASTGAAGAVRLPLMLACCKTLAIKQASLGQKAFAAHARTSRSHRRYHILFCAARRLYSPTFKRADAAAA